MVNSSIDSIRLEAREITLRSKRKKRLDNLTFTLEPGHLIAIVGGSGAGKSTLMRVLLGNETPTSGTIHLNGVSLRENYDLFRQQIGYVPQDDIVHPDLTVEESLYCAAKLRLPAGTKIREVVERLNRFNRITQQAIGLFEDRQGAMKWLQTPKHSLAGITPLAALSSDKGAQQVEELLYRAEYGIYG